MMRETDRWRGYSLSNIRFAATETERWIRKNDTTGKEGSRFHSEAFLFEDDGQCMLQVSGERMSKENKTESSIQMM
jgi:hypothetical protein